jgi:hypothetical protein
METKDDFLTEFREEPRPEFAEALFARIDRAPDRAETADVPGGQRWRPAFAAAGALAGLVVLFSFPAVRAAAQDFLDLFRVQRFVAVPVDPARAEQLRSGKVGLETLLSDSVEELTPRSEPRAVDSPERAAAATGIPILVPTYVFNVNDAPQIFVEGEHAARITADAERLRGLLDALGITDVEVPAALDGAQITVRVPAAVQMRYRRGDAWVATFTQARSPEVDLPAGVNLAELGEIGLRVAGLSAAEAHEFARKIDWHSTLLVPVPANAGSFTEVNVHGTTGLLISVDSSKVSPEARERGESPRTILLWSENGMIYALASTMHPVDTIEMANSLRNG